MVLTKFKMHCLFRDSKLYNTKLGALPLRTPCANLFGVFASLLHNRHDRRSIKVGFADLNLRFLPIG